MNPRPATPFQQRVNGSLLQVSPDSSSRPRGSNSQVQQADTMSPLSSCLALLLTATLCSCAPAHAPRHPAPPAPRPYAPAPAPAYQDPYHNSAPVVLCEHYPYCNNAPHNIYHLQDEINALRQRNALIVAAGERLAQQLPNRPFVGGYQYL